MSNLHWFVFSIAIVINIIMFIFLHRISIVNAAFSPLYEPLLFLPFLVPCFHCKFNLLQWFQIHRKKLTTKCSSKLFILGNWLTILFVAYESLCVCERANLVLGQWSTMPWLRFLFSNQISLLICYWSQPHFLILTCTSLFPSTERNSPQYHVVWFFLKGKL